MKSSSFQMCVVVCSIAGAESCKTIWGIIGRRLTGYRCYDSIETTIVGYSGVSCSLFVAIEFTEVEGAFFGIENPGGAEDTLENLAVFRSEVSAGEGSVLTKEKFLQPLDGGVADLVLVVDHLGSVGELIERQQHRRYCRDFIELLKGVRLQYLIKEVLGLWIGESEGARFWLSVFTELKKRGVEDILIACVDGLKGLSEAIRAVLPDAAVQLCVIHMIRNLIKYLPHKHSKAFISDLKRVYRAVSEKEAEEHLLELQEIWEEKYPLAVKPWVTNWENVKTFFSFSEEIRRIIYTTNAVESLHRQFRKTTNNRAVFPNDESLQKLLYLAVRDLSEKCSLPVLDLVWSKVGWGVENAFTQLFLHPLERSTLLHFKFKNQ